MKQFSSGICSMFIKPLFLVSGLLATFLQVNAQTRLSFLEDTTLMKSGSTLQLRALLINSTLKTRHYHITLNPGDFQVLNTLPARIILAAGDSLLIPVILFAGRKTNANKPHPVTLKAIPDSGNALSRQCLVKLQAEERVYLTVSRPDIYLKPGDDSISIQVQLHNAGNTDQQVIIAVNGQSDNQAWIKKTLHASAFTDTILSVNARLPSALRQHSVGHLLVTGHYANGDIFSTVQVNVFSTDSRKSFVYDPTGSWGHSNMMGFYTRYLGTDFQYYELTGNGGFSAGKARIKYELDALYYPAFDRSSLVLMNSHINYLTNKWNIQAGNVYRDDEMLLNGRGIAFQITPSSSTSWEAGYLNDNYNLVGGLKNNYFNSGHTVYANYSSTLKNKMSVKGLAIQQWDPDYKGNSSLGGGSIGFNIFHHHRIELGAYASYHNKGINRKDSSGKWGEAALVSYTGTAGRWQLQSSNYLSTRSYSGFEKGAVNLQERIGFTSDDNINFWAQYNKVSNHAEYAYVNMNYFNPSYANEVAEIGMNAYIRKRLSLTLRPYYSAERSENNFISSQYTYAIRATHIDLGLNYNVSYRQSVYLKIDAGKSSANLNAYKHYFAFKVNARYQYGPFSINTAYQSAPYYSGELAIYKYTLRKYGLFMISPAFNGYLFHHKLAINAYNSVEYEKSYRRWTDNINVNLTWHMKHHFNLIFNFNKIQYFIFDKSINGFDIGIEKNFNTEEQGKHLRLKLHLFEDKNGNDIPDAGEKPVADQLIKVGDDLFTTDKEGEIVYKGLPPGNYHVSILQSNGMMARDTVINVRSKTNIYIPMHEIKMITGNIKLTLQRYSYETDETVAGIRITATDKTGKRFEAITDAKGVFTLYLPSNSYKVELETNTLPEKYICSNPTRNVNLSGVQQKKITFEVSVQKRQIEIYKFKSSSLKDSP